MTEPALILYLLYLAMVSVFAGFGGWFAIRYLVRKR